MVFWILMTEYHQQLVEMERLKISKGPRLQSHDIQQLQKACEALGNRATKEGHGTLPRLVDLAD